MVDQSLALRSQENGSQEQPTAITRMNLKKQSMTAMVPYTENTLSSMIEKLYPGTDAVVRRATVLLGLKYGLDPILKEVMIIKTGSTKDSRGNWQDVYSAYVGIAGMESVANRAGQHWTIQMDQPERRGNPYVLDENGKPKEDIWLEATLYRSGCRPFTDGRWFSEVCRFGKNGEPISSWAVRPSEMHRKAVRLYLLRRAFSVTSQFMAPPDFVAEEDEEPDEQGGMPQGVMNWSELTTFIESRAHYHHGEGNRGPANDMQKRFLQSELMPLEHAGEIFSGILLRKPAELKEYEALAIMDWLRQSVDPQAELNRLAARDTESASGIIIDHGPSRYGAEDDGSDVTDAWEGAPIKAKRKAEPQQEPMPRREPEPATNPKPEVETKPKSGGKKLNPVNQIRQTYSHAPDKNKGVPPTEERYGDFCETVLSKDLDPEQIAQKVFEKPLGGLDAAQIEALIENVDLLAELG